MQKEEIKSCKNCKYFIQHYAKHSFYYSKIYCGHCTNSNFKVSDRRKKFPYVQGCDLWKDCEKQPPDYKNIEEAFQTVSDILVYLRQIINEK